MESSYAKGRYNICIRVNVEIRINMTNLFNQTILFFACILCFPVQIDIHFIFFVHSLRE